MPPEGNRTPVTWFGQNRRDKEVEEKEKNLIQQLHPTTKLRGEPLTAM
jgi:hypothetical protein